MGDGGEAEREVGSLLLPLPILMLCSPVILLHRLLLSLHLYTQREFQVSVLGGGILISWSPGILWMAFLSLCRLPKRRAGATALC